jgi:hypothetical protein
MVRFMVRVRFRVRVKVMIRIISTLFPFDVFFLSSF